MIGYVYLTINDTHIAECCRKERKTAYGFKWAFADEWWKI